AGWGRQLLGEGKEAPGVNPSPGGVGESVTTPHTRRGKGATPPQIRGGSRSVRRCSSSKAGPRGMSRCPGPGLRVYELIAGPCEGFGRLVFDHMSKVLREHVDFERAY